MIYTAHYKSSVGELLLAAKEDALIGLWIEGQKNYFSNIKEEIIENEQCEIIQKSKNWLDRYFAKEKPTIDELKLAPAGSEFAQKVWNLLKQIPYGETITYGEIAKEIAKMQNIERMSAQAVGGAVGHNPISIIIPCHRVIGSNGQLTGYAGGIDKKIKLLSHEGVL